MYMYIRCTIRCEIWAEPAQLVDRSSFFSRKSDCLVCAVLLCLVCLFDLMYMWNFKPKLTSNSGSFVPALGVQCEKSNHHIHIVHAH